MTEIVEDTKGKTRDLPIDQKLKSILISAGIEAGVDKVRVTSGGQCAQGTCTKRFGSNRHDLGKAADLEIWKNNRALNFTSDSDLPTFKAFVIAAARLGATGIGAGIDYMGPKTIHVGFGSKAVWGANGSTANAPTWLKEAAQEGWSSSTLPISLPFVVIARNGLRLRSGPGVDFTIISTLEKDTVVNVNGYSGANQDWARVDLQGDGLIDGYLYKEFLMSADKKEGQDDCCPDNEEADSPGRLKDTVGVRNKNYLNVKNDPANPWEGSTGTDSRGHAIFDDPAYGIRAAIITLRSYWFRHNRRTIAEILSRWAPATDTIGSLPGAPPNSPEAYSKFVSDRTGIDFNEKLEFFSDSKDIENKSQLEKVLQAMAEYENYVGFNFPSELFDKSLTLLS
jgi:Bacterial SH3 domain